MCARAPTLPQLKREPIDADPGAVHGLLGFGIKAEDRAWFGAAPSLRGRDAQVDASARGANLLHGPDTSTSGARVASADSVDQRVSAGSR